MLLSFDDNIFFMLKLITICFECI